MIHEEFIQRNDRRKWEIPGARLELQSLASESGDEVVAHLVGSRLYGVWGPNKYKNHIYIYISGQIIATSQEFSPQKGS